ncbi:hypothetical protein [Actinokineospora globicatena]|uniref:hypothetical protein n=1 Tax=Actinokineospora globicatena TaxID=103729 RepID=UPI0020A556CE|nr:hypothetical protein [Actinokineospora globicatena]MCP2302145.1 hypothetical protein [Actinokineospora globicatena]GLW76194.1 hypothetical protein Aglo01_06760 [Actinokineospora globicatena]GLW83030.1 hypothetical protein Aglo02_06700 [Actinokineospora globicatena]
MRLSSTAPRTVLGAGALVCLQGLAALVFTVLLLVRGLSGDSEMGTNVFGEAAYFAVLAAGVLACGGGLLIGKTWARSPAVVLQVLLLGVAWYAIGPSGRPEYGTPVAVLSLVTLVLLFRPATNLWAQGEEQE